MWGKATDCITLIVFVRVWERPNHEPYQFFMLFLALIHLHFNVKRDEIGVVSMADDVTDVCLAKHSFMLLDAATEEAGGVISNSK